MATGFKVAAAFAHPHVPIVFGIGFGKFGISAGSWSESVKGRCIESISVELEEEKMMGSFRSNRTGSTSWQSELCHSTVLPQFCYPTQSTIALSHPCLAVSC